MGATFCYYNKINFSHFEVQNLGVILKGYQPCQ